MKLGRSIGDFAVKLPVVGPVARTLRDHGLRFHRPTRAAGGNASSMPAPTTSATFSTLGWTRSATRSRTARRILPIRLSIKRDTTSIVWLYEKPDTSTFRYRVYTMEEALASDPARRASAAWLAVDEIAALRPRCGMPTAGTSSLTVSWKRRCGMTNPAETLGELGSLALLGMPPGWSTRSGLLRRNSSNRTMLMVPGAAGLSAWNRVSDRSTTRGTHRHTRPQPAVLRDAADIRAG